MNDVEILRVVNKLTERHTLKSAPEAYVRGFALAASSVYPPDRVFRILQERFFIPDDSRFDLDTYLQSAAELTVQNDIKLKSAVTDFSVDKEVNPPKDVDVYFKTQNTKVSLEVKCAVESKTGKDAVVIKTAGRIPGHLSQFEELQKNLRRANPSQEVVFGKNKDNTCKDFIVSAHDKFSPDSGVDDCNILLIACGYHFNISEWRMYLLQNEGLFTRTPFYPERNFERVDVVVLSNLKYFHTDARAHHDWTLRNVFMLPEVNPHARRNNTSSAILKGLSVFNHHLKSFSVYKMKNIGGVEPSNMLDAIKLGYYVNECLTIAEQNRYFPVKMQ